MIEKVYYETFDGKRFEDEYTAREHEYKLSLSNAKYVAYDKDLNVIGITNNTVTYIYFGDMSESQLEALFEMLYDDYEIGLCRYDRELFQPNSVICYVDDPVSGGSWVSWEGSDPEQEYLRLKQYKDNIDKVLSINKPQNPVGE